MLEELKAIEQNHTWELFTLPEGKTPIGLKWVFKVKHNADRSVKRYKARLVAKGYSQHQGTPMNTNEKLQVEDGTEAVNPSLYRSIIGGLNYLTHTRPYIMYSVNVLSRFMHKPTRLHLGATKRVLRYVAGTVDFGLWYSKSTNAVSWSSKKQDVVALSSSEAEYVDVASAACQATWLRRMLVDFNNEQYGPTTIFCENKATIAMTRNPTFHSRTKHIDICFHFIRDLTSKGIIELTYCPTNEQVADVFTKALSQAKHDYFRQKLGVCKFRARGCIE
nr:retrovirus-related Pol polyprotein from transposon TNT 1-94 [Tanacetum cinerariifolium]